MANRETLRARQQQEVMYAQHRTEATLRVEQKRNPWGIYDSQLRRGFLGRMLPETDLRRAVFGKTFQESFAPVLPPDRDLKQDIETELAQFQGQALGVEFGGIGSNLFAGFEDDFFEETLGMNLVDRRNTAKKRRDEGRHTVIPGDMVSEEGKANLNEWLQGRQVHLIIERMMRGLEAAPNDVEVISDYLQDWYRILAEGGLMYLQAPRIMAPLLEKWAAKVEQVSQGTIEVTIGQDHNVPWLSIRIHKKAGAPEEIPLLSLLEATRILRKNEMETIFSAHLSSQSP